MKMHHIIYLHLVVVVILRANVLELVDYHVSVLHDVPLPLMGQRAMGWSTVSFSQTVSCDSAGKPVLPTICSLA